MKLFLIIPVLLMLFAMPADASTFNAESLTLSNGLEVVVIPNHRAPVISHMVWYKVGAADEAPGQSGIAHFLEHLMFKGTAKIPEGMFSKIIKQHGGNDNAFTAQDYTAYYQNISKDHLEMVMEMEADRMKNLQLSEAAVNSERDVILEERRQVVDNKPTARFAEEMRNLIFPNHPYGTPTIGWMHEMAALTYGYAIDFYKKWYVPNNAILVIAGDVTLAEIKPLAEKYYGVIPAGTVPPRIRPSLAPVVAQRRVVMEDAQVREPMVQISWRVPSTRMAPETSHGLQVLGEILGGGTTSRLYQSLVVNQKIATSASFSYSTFNIDMTTATIYLSPAPGITFENLEQAAHAEIEKLVTVGITADELNNAKENLIAQAIYAQDSLQQPAYIFGTALATGMRVNDVESWRVAIGAVSTEQVKKAAADWLSDPKKTVIGHLLPERAAQ